jgi:hypothetical protein
MSRQLSQDGRSTHTPRINSERGQDAVFQREVLLGAALGQSGGTPDNPWLLDHLVASELIAGQVHLGSVGQEIPVVHALAAAVGPEHLGNQQLAA